MHETALRELYVRTVELVQATCVKFTQQTNPITVSVTIEVADPISGHKFVRNVTVSYSGY